MTRPETEVSSTESGQHASPRANRIRLVWRKVRAPAAICLAVLALGLGWFGFDALAMPASFWDKFYLSIQLFVLQSGAVPPPVPWELEIARLLAPAVAAYATLSALAALFHEQFTRMRVRMFARDHVVVCGLGQIGGLLARNLRAAGYEKVVALEADPQSGEAGECREVGVTVLVGDAADRTQLRAAGVRDARFLFAATGDDGTNAEIAIEARELVADRKRGGTLTCFVHILDPVLRDVLARSQVTASDRAPFRLEFFNAAERGAPTLLDRYPFFDEAGTTPLGPPRAVVVGLGEMGSKLVVHAARHWRSWFGPDADRFKVTVVDEKADDRVAALEERYPRLASACEMVPLRMDVGSAEFEHAGFLFDENGGCDVTGVYVCLGDDARGLSAALHLHRRLGELPVRIVVRTTQHGGVAGLLAREGSRDGCGGLEVFGLLDLVCEPSVLLRGQNEVLARTIHEDYVRHQRAEGMTPERNPSMADWESLPESLKDSNRDQAADIGKKLAAVGCDVVPLLDWDAEPVEFTPAEVELLARMEHDRWWRDREADGWTFAPAKDVDAKESPYLVPYDELSEEVKGYDRNTVRALPAFLAEVGFAAVRVKRRVSHG